MVYGLKILLYQAESELAIIAMLATATGARGLADPLRGYVKRLTKGFLRFIFFSGLYVIEWILKTHRLISLRKCDLSNRHTPQLPENPAGIRSLSGRRWLALLPPLPCWVWGGSPHGRMSE